MISFLFSPLPSKSQYWYYMITIASTFKLKDSLSFNSADMVMWTDNLNKTPFLFVVHFFAIIITIIFHIVKEQGGTIRRNLSGVGTRLPHTFLSSPSPKSSSSPSSSPPSSQYKYKEQCCCLCSEYMYFCVLVFLRFVHSDLDIELMITVRSLRAALLSLLRREKRFV